LTPSLRAFLALEQACFSGKIEVIKTEQAFFVK